MLRSLPKLSFPFSTTNTSHHLANGQCLKSSGRAIRRAASAGFNQPSILHHFLAISPPRCDISRSNVTCSQLPFMVEIRMTTPFPIQSMSASTSSSPTAAEVAPEDEVRQVKLLTSTNDDHGGVIVEINEPMDSTTFLSILRASIAHWKQLGKKGVWIKLPIHLVNLVEALVKEGFWYHHAEPKYLMLVYWIPESANTIPANATHRVGVGAFVMNEKREVLVVQEKSGLFRGTGVWKFPTGVVDQGEDICVAAVREVKEETGVDSEFVEVLAFRQGHKSFFEKSDLFFVCMLRPLSFDIQLQELEIEAVQWMPFEEYATQPFVQKQELLRYINDICLAKIDGHYSGFYPVPTSSNFSQKKSYLYLNAGGLKRCNSI